MNKAFVMLAIVILFPRESSATDLINKDSKTYEIAVNSGGGTAKMSIASGTNKSGVCASTVTSCKITVTDVGEIEVTGADNVVIEGGKLAKK